MDWKTLEAYPKTWKWVLPVCGVLFMIMNLPALPGDELNFGMVVSGTSFLALYGLAYERPIWSQKFWKAFFWVFVVMCAFVAAIIGLTIASSSDQFNGGQIDGATAMSGNSLSVLLALLVFGIQMRGVYLYAFRRRNLWTQKQGNI